MAQATIKLEFMVGDSIKNCFEEAIRIARFLNVNTEFDFNGITCIASEDGSASEGEKNYRRILKNANKSSRYVKIAYSNFSF